MKAPVEMPTMYVRQQEFKIERDDYAAPEASGRVGGVQSGWPLWSAVYSLTDAMPEDYSDEWECFLDSQRGSTRRFIGFDLKRRFPKLYPDGFGSFGAFTGAATSWSSTINADGDCELTLNLGAAAAGLSLSKRDGIDFRYEATEAGVEGLPWRAYVRVQSGATANGSGNFTVIVEPPVPDAVPSDAIAHLDEPGCVMVLVPGQSSVGPIDRRYSIQGGEIVAIQDLRG